MERVTVTLPADLVKGIDQLERNRSRFVLEAVRRELERRRREELHNSLANPHPEGLKLADLGFEAWAQGLPEENLEDLLDPRAGRSIQWEPGRGWFETQS